MRKQTTRRIRRTVALGLAASALAVTAAARGLASPAERALGPAEPAPTRVAASPSAAVAANDPTIDLCATDGTLNLPGNISVPIWGFVMKPAGGECSAVAGKATLPGPVLDVNQDDLVHLNVTNALPAGHTISIEAPGIDFEPGDTDAAVGETVQRSFTAGAPGTYVYQSVGDTARQTAMGLYGALIVRPHTSGQAYNDPASAYNVEATLVLSAIDPAFNAAPDDFDLHRYRATYWLINGKAHPETDPIHASPGQRVLLRYVNAGYDNTTMALLGMHERVLARDAQPLANPFDADAETLPAGATEDALAIVPPASSALPHGFPLYNRQLHLANGTGSSSPGGMLTFITPP